ncbi:MAG: glycosyltransferase, partial [Myxococcales bacterium]|nr:glycosyltransferase [Myxococcales bacterium]
MLSRRLRILATAFGPVPGAGSHSAALMAMAGGLRAELDMITLKAEGLAYQGRIGEARLFRVRVGGTPDERREAFGRAVRRQLEAQPYDVVHTRGPFDGSVVASLADELGYRFVYEVATFPDEAEGGQAELEWEQRHLYCLERAELILVQTEAAARHLGDRGFAGKVAVVPPGVDVNGFDWWPSLPNDPPRLIYLGGCGADRDLATLLSAIRALRRRRRLQVLIAGEPRPEARQ